MRPPILLLDTCCLLWLAADPARLSETSRALIARSAGSLYVSAISAFEIAVKSRKGRLTLALDPEAWFERALLAHGLIEEAVDWRIAARSATLRAVHADPCDRIIVATAQLRGMTV